MPDYLGMFAVTAGIGADELARQFERDHDDYNAIMVKALADRLAEAFAEYLHAQARKDWGYGEQEQLSREDLIAEKYRGIRPAFGYPACPDHSEKFKLFELLDAAEAGDHADRERRDAAGRERQRAVLLASRRRSTSTSAGSAATRSSPTRAARACALEEVEQWLAPNLAYDPSRRRRPDHLNTCAPAAYSAAGDTQSGQSPLSVPGVGIQDTSRFAAVSARVGLSAGDFWRVA